MHERGTRGAREVHERCTRGAREGHERCICGHLRGHGIFHFDTVGTRLGHGDIGAIGAQEVHERGTRGAREVHERGTRGAREGHERGTRGAREVHRLTFLRPNRLLILIGKFVKYMIHFYLIELLISGINYLERFVCVAMLKNLKLSWRSLKLIIFTWQKLGTFGMFLKLF